MPFFYKHIVPTGLKRCTTGEKHIEKDASVKMCFTKSYLAQVVELMRRSVSVRLETAPTGGVHIFSDFAIKHHGVRKRGARYGTN